METGPRQSKQTAVSLVPGFKEYTFMSARFVAGALLVSARLGRARFNPVGPGPANAVALFYTRETPPGTRFRYASIETQVLGLVLAGAVQATPAAYLQTRLWQPMGSVQ
jgi:CubicO group peptidase (beta-lactamase class C family)